MPGHHLVRVGLMGHVGQFLSLDSSRYPRGARVVTRTRRGLEVGDVLAPPTIDAFPAVADGQILRGMTDQDELLLSRIQRHRREAFEACRLSIAERGHSVTLIDVEHLFDGRGLYFYFLGEVTPEIESLTSELAEIYDAQSQFRRFAQTLAEGCGPDCGTEDGEGSCGSCSTCAVAVACGRG